MCQSESWFQLPGAERGFIKRIVVCKENYQKLGGSGSGSEDLAALAGRLGAALGFLSGTELCMLLLLSSGDLISLSQIPPQKRTSPPSRDPCSWSRSRCIWFGQVLAPFSARLAWEHRNLQYWPGQWEIAPPLNWTHKVGNFSGKGKWGRGGFRWMTVKWEDMGTWLQLERRWHWSWRRTICVKWASAYPGEDSYAFIPRLESIVKQ